VRQLDTGISGRIRAFCPATNIDALRLKPVQRLFELLKNEWKQRGSVRLEFEKNISDGLTLISTDNFPHRNTAVTLSVHNEKKTRLMQNVMRMQGASDRQHRRPVPQ